MLRELIYSSIGLLFLAYVLDYVISFANDAREPKRANPKVPLIGHLLGMVKYGGSYFTHTGSIQTNDEIYTLAIINTKIYVSNSLRLMPLIQKASKTLSFPLFHKIAIQNISGCSAASADLFDGPLTDDYGHILRATLAPGPWLDEQNLRMGQSGATLVDAIINGGKEKIWLLEWARHIVVQASSCGVFGKEHPFLDPEVEKAFWKLQAHIPMHMASLDFFGKAVESRKVIHKALLKYCAAPPADAARTLLERQRVLREAGMSFEDAARQETGMCVAMFGSTVATLYWTIWELFSRPGLLAEVREEIGTQAVSRKSGEGEAHGVDADFLLDIAALKTRCPLLLSVFQETQRTRHVHANIRYVLEDTLLDDGRYLLRKGNYLMMPGSPIHHDVNVWGKSAGTFNPYRFVPKTSKGDAAPLPSGFLSWGAPPYLCPARQFASTEILIIVALLTMRVDLVPVASNGRWERSPALNYSELISVFNPAKDVEMFVKPREQGVGKWALKMGESKTRVPIASG